MPGNRPPATDVTPSTHGATPFNLNHSEVTESPDVEFRPDSPFLVVAAPSRLPSRVSTVNNHLRRPSPFINFGPVESALELSCLPRSRD